MTRRRLHWGLMDVMATRKMRFAPQLHAALEARGVKISVSQVQRLMNSEFLSLRVDLLEALCDIFDCGVHRLLVIEEDNDRESEVSTRSRSQVTGDIEGRVVPIVPRLL